MSGQIPRPRSITLVATLLAWSISIAASTITARADDCLAEPNSPAPAGSHWYYHFDKATQRKCWYIHAKDQSVQPAAAQATSDPASLPPAAAIPLEKPAPASASDPMSISPGDSAPPLPRVKVPAVKPQRASVSGTATDQSAQQGVQEATPQASPALSIQAPAPQASPSSQTSNQGATTRSVPTSAWPDPPVVTFKTEEPTAPPSDTRTESIRPTIDPLAPDNAERTARVGASTTNTAGATTSASTMPVAMLAIVALGLVVAGILLRVVMKISVMKIFPARRQPITTDDHDFDRIDDLAHEWHEDQVVDGALSEYLKRPKISAASDSKRRPSQIGTERRPSQIGTDRADITRAGDSAFHITDKMSMRKHRRIDVNPRQSESSDAQPQHESGSIDPPEPDSIDDRRQDEGRRQHGSEADELLHDLQSSLIAAASEYRAPPSQLQADDGWSNDGRGKHGPSPIGDEIREREEVLERLRRDLDRLLQSPKVA
jgi:hypothetical protein